MKGGLERQRLDVEHSSFHAFVRGVGGDFGPESLGGEALECDARMGRLVDGVEAVAVEGFFDGAEVVDGIFAGVDDGGEGGEEGEGGDYFHWSEEDGHRLK